MRGVIEDSSEPLCETAERSRYSFRTAEEGTVSGTEKETSSDHQPNITETLDLLRQLPRSKAPFTLLDWSRNNTQFYGTVYLGNGTVMMRSVIHNQGGSISNSGGSMNLSNVAGPMQSGNVRGTRNFTTKAPRPIPSPSVRFRQSLRPFRGLISLMK